MQILFQQHGVEPKPCISHKLEDGAKVPASGTQLEKQDCRLLPVYHSRE